MEAEWTNKLYFGDNLPILREHVADESVDLIYLDPPFNSKATYNVLFREANGTESPAQITAFDDFWHWDMAAESAFHEVVTGPHAKVSDLLQALRRFLGTNDMMAYLTMMAIRLVELHRVLKPTGSIYLHCDPTASHYLKLLMDAVWGADNFRNEIIWHYGGRGAKAIARQFPRNHDIILFYSKAPGRQLFRHQYTRHIYTQAEARRRGLRQDENGRWFKTAPRGDYTDDSVRRLEAEGRIHRTRTGGIRVKYFLETEGDLIAEDALVGDTWFDIADAMHIGKERLGYPTQKPEALLERIISASSNEGDLVLDPFCGCGTTVAVAERLHRRWIGIDITHLAIALMRNRLHDAFGEDLNPYEVIGEPKDLPSAKALALENRHQFQYWALGLVRARPAGKPKKGADRGIDGMILFFDDNSGKAKRGILQVKSGHVSVSHVRDLKGVMEREKAAIGALITLEKPTRPMLQEAAEAGLYDPPSRLESVPRVQVLTIEGLLAGTEELQLPHRLDLGLFGSVADEPTFKRAPRRIKAKRAKKPEAGESE